MINVFKNQIHTETFLPGILVENGKIKVDEAELTYPGDLLHEVGHLAVAPGHLRFSLSGEVVLPGVHMEVIESQAIAWSYAAILFIGMDPKVVFHEGGYSVESERLMMNFELEVYPGANGLEDAGLTVVGAGQ